MKLLDANLLLYAVNKDAPLHSQAKAWLETTLSGRETVGFSWNVILAFVRLTTRPGLFRNALSPERAFDLVAAWLDQPSATVVNPGPRHLAILRGLLTSLGTGGNLTSDAHLAALAIEQNAELCSCDADFARFAGLHWRNPLR
jgi:toxin-antitoxin system PIN domain toxin